MRALSLALSAVLSATTGCYGVTIGQEPTPVAPGKVRGTAGLGWNLERPAPYLHAGLRVGLARAVEARLKLTLLNRFSMEGGVNVEAYAGRVFRLFLMPHYRYYNELAEDEFSLREDDERLLFRRTHAFAAPVLFVFRAWGQDLFVGPDLHAGVRTGRGFLALGAHVGAGIHLGRHVSLTPELGLLVITAGKREPRTFDETLVDEVKQRVLFAPGNVMAELGLSLSFGGTH